MKNKLVVILGPTSSGKTDLSIKLAKKFTRSNNFAGAKLKSRRLLFNRLNGVEIVSADSRQVYKGMDIGTGKITKKEMSGIPHHLLDIANPRKKFSVAQYQKLALKAIKNIQKKNKIPFLVGGTGFYIQSIVDDIVIPKVKPDWILRKKLEKLTKEQLFEKLKKLDTKRAESIDKQNPRRLIRALEIILKTGNPVPATATTNPELGELPQGRVSGNFQVLEIGIMKSQEELKKLIHKRLMKRLQNDAMIKEVKKLRKSLSWKRLEEFGLEYRFVAQYLSQLQNPDRIESSRKNRNNKGLSTKSGQNKINYQKMIDNIQIESEHLVKKQMTWFKRDKKIHWVKKYKEAEKLIKDFLN